MMQKKKGVYATVALMGSLLLFLTCSHGSAEPLRVGASVAPPYYTVEGDQVTGIFGELMATVFSEAGLDFVWKPYPTKRVYVNLIKGDIDVYLGPLKPSFEGFNDSVLHSDMSPMSIELHCFYYGPKPEMTRKEDLFGKNILIIRGYTYGGLVNEIFDPKNQVTYQEITSFEQAIKMLREGRADYHLDYRKTGERFLADHPDPALQHSTILAVDVHVMVSKKAPNAEQLLTRLEQVLRSLQEQE